MATKAIRQGDYVRITGTETFSDGKEGSVIEVIRADRDYERRARILVSSAYQPIIAMKFLEPVEAEGTE